MAFAYILIFWLCCDTFLFFFTFSPSTYACTVSCRLHCHCALVCVSDEKWLGHCVFGPDDEDKPACQFIPKPEQHEGPKAEPWDVVQGKDVTPFPQPDHTLNNISGQFSRKVYAIQLHRIVACNHCFDEVYHVKYFFNVIP